MRQRRIVAVNGHGRIVKRCEKILLDTAYLRCVFFEALQDILDMLDIQLHQLAFDYLYRLFIPGNAYRPPSAAADIY